MNIFVAFLGSKDICGWPYKSFDFDAQIQKIKKTLTNIENINNEKVEFFGFKHIENDRNIVESYKEMEKADGLIIATITAEFASLGPSISKLCEMDIPTIVYNIPFSVYYDGFATLYHSGVKALLVSSSDPKDLQQALIAVNTVVKLKKLNLLIVRDLDHDYSKIEKDMLDPARWKGPKYVRMIKEIFGVSLIFAESNELLKCYDSVDDKMVENDLVKIDEKTIKEPPKTDLFRAVKMYYAMKKLMEERNCNGITVDCLSYIREKKLPISPCYGLSRLLREGVPAGCEGDVDSTITLAISLYLTQIPGFMGDPVLDHANKQLTLAHCTSSCRLCTPQKDIEDVDYFFRTHNESHSDVGIQAFMKPNLPVTVMKIMHSGFAQFIGQPTVFTSTSFIGYHLLCYESKTSTTVVDDHDD
ncbi:hypothetical protein M0811_04334 [Anaeramoeba ignava]|uniref:Uncharacterized protein n=1 Tax=Anaeramoeba ignava TaxID=1746090 RepID=A0A9Q0LXM6_ANAIG|nr:hypothetical protein M0811_04334 [Anaeramoeba ignava]